MILLQLTVLFDGCGRVSILQRVVKRLDDRRFWLESVQGIDDSSDPPIGRHDRFIAVRIPFTQYFFLNHLFGSLPLRVLLAHCFHGLIEHRIIFSQFVHGQVSSMSGDDVDVIGQDFERPFDGLRVFQSAPAVAVHGREGHPVHDVAHADDLGVHKPDDRVVIALAPGDRDDPDLFSVKKDGQAVRKRDLGQRVIGIFFDHVGAASNTIPDNFMTYYCRSLAKQLISSEVIPVLMGDYDVLGLITADLFQFFFQRRCRLH